MLALLGLILVLAIAIALAPVILGVIGTMFALVVTAILFVAAGCPRHEAPKRTPTEERTLNADIEQLEAWAAEERDNRRDAGKKRRHAR